MDGALADIAAVTASLYLRLGGASGVPAVVDDAVDRHAANPTLAPRMRGLDLPQLKALGVGFLSARAGGPPHDAAPQHARLSFIPAELQAVVATTSTRSPSTVWEPPKSVRSWACSTP